MLPHLCLLLLLMLAMLQHCDGCSCMPAHPQQQFCKSEYVLKIRIRGKEMLNNEVVEKESEMMSYSVKTLKIYKLPQNVANVTEIVTYTSQAMCGLPNFGVNIKYLVSGRFLNGKAVIVPCNYWMAWAEMTLLEKKRLKKYGKYCNQGCEIEACWKKNGCQSASNRCYVPKWHYAEDCYNTHGICSRKLNRKCKWLEDGVLRTCVRKRKKEYYEEP